MTLIKLNTQTCAACVCNLNARTHEKWEMRNTIFFQLQLITNSIRPSLKIQACCFGGTDCLSLEIFKFLFTSYYFIFAFFISTFYFKINLKHAKSTHIWSTYTNWSLSKEGYYKKKRNYFCANRHSTDLSALKRQWIMTRDAIKNESARRYLCFK